MPMSETPDQQPIPLRSRQPIPVDISSMVYYLIQTPSTISPYFREFSADSTSNQNASVAPDTFLSITKDYPLLQEETRAFLQYANTILPSEDSEKNTLPGMKQEILRILGIAFIYVSHALHPERLLRRDKEIVYPNDMATKVGITGFNFLQKDRATQSEREWYQRYFSQLWQKSVTISLAYRNVPENNFTFSRLQDDLQQGKELFRRFFRGEPFNLPQAILSLSTDLPPKPQAQSPLPSVGDLLNPNDWNTNPEERDPYLDE